MVQCSGQEWLSSDYRIESVSVSDAVASGVTDAGQHKIGQSCKPWIGLILSVRHSESDV